MNLFRRMLILAGCAAALGLGTSAVKAEATQRTLLSGHLQPVVPGLQSQGRLDGSTRLKLSIALPLRNREALADFVETLYDPSSPLYRHYLTPEEFSARFGPTEEDYQAVLAWAAGSGFTVTARHPSRMLLEVSAPVADIERALKVAMRTYAHPTEPRTFFSPDSEPSVATAVPILWIGGLDNFNRPHPKNLRRAPLNTVAQATPQIVGSGPNGNLAGFDYRAAYAPGVTLTGTGQMIGLVEFDGYYANDIASYESLTGVPDVPLQVVTLDGFDGQPTAGAGSGNSEVALDIEMAISMAPGLSKVVVFEAGPNGMPNDVLACMATNTLIKQFSCSWGFGSVTKAQRTNMDDYFLQFETQGQSFFASSGDSGAATNGFAISPPDDDPYITLVGGTTLSTAGPGASWLSETVWNAGDGPGNNNSTGGISTIYRIPSWQTGVKMTANYGSTIRRNCPDVAMVADNIFIVADDGQRETTGGTSTATPLWAGFAALANQQAATAGVSNIGFINPALYRIGTNSGYTACFDDITVGNNTNNSATHFLATPGFDLCTGWGSPSGGSLIIALTQPDGFQITPGRGAVANGPAGGPFTVSTQTFTLTNTGMTDFNWSLGTTSAWLDVSGGSGTLAAGGAAASVTVTLNSVASLLPAGVYTNELWFTNLTSHLAQLRQFTLQVGQELVQDGGFEAGDFCYWTLSGNSSAYAYNFVDDGTYTYYSPNDGNYFAALGQGSNLAWLSQPLPTLPNQLYLVSLWLENPSGATPNQFLIRWNTNASTTNVIFNQKNMGAFDWTNLVFTVEASANTATLQFGFRNDNDFFGLDDVSVVPLPASALASPTITGKPTVPSGILQGEKLNLTIAATGSGLTYEWLDNNAILTNNGVNISGSDTSNLVINPAYVTNSGSYQVVVSNSGGSATSGVFTVTVSKDTSMPTVTIASPVKDGTRSNLVQWLFSGTAADNVRVTNVSYWITNLNGAPSAQGPFSANLTAGAGAKSPSNWTAIVSPPAGSNIFAVRSWDFSGNPSPIISRKFFAKSPVPLSLNIAGTGSGKFKGSNFITGETNVPAKDALLNVGESYSITALQDPHSYFVGWTGTAGAVASPTLKFIMESNTSLTANFITNMFLGMAGKYNGLFTNTNGVIAEETAGMIGGLTLKTNGLFSATLYLDGSAPGISGTFSPEGFWSNSVSTVLDRNVKVELNVNGGSTPRTITGWVIGTNQGGWTSGVMLVASTNNSSLDAARYTLLIPPASPSPVATPPGYGYVLLTNTAATATVTLGGALADGTAISQTVPIGEDNAIPVYPSPYNKATNGMLFGRLSLSSNSPAAPGPSGTLTWIRKASASGLLKAGFTNSDLEVQGSPWISSVPLTAVIPSGSPLTVSGGGLTNALTPDVSVVNKTSLAPTNTTPNYKSGSVNTNNGLMTLTFTNNSKVIVTAHGALLQDFQFGGGFFVSPANKPTNFGTITLGAP